MMGSLRSDLDFCGETLLNLCLTLWHNLYKRLKLLSACMLVLIAIIIILRINNCVVVVKRWGSWISLLRIEFAKVSFKWFTIKCMITFVSLAYWMCEKAHQEEKNTQKVFNGGFSAASKKFECANTSKPPLLTAKLCLWLSLWDLNAARDQFQYMERVENPFELSGEAGCSSVSKPGVKLALWETFGGTGWMDFKEVDKAAHTCVKQNRILHIAANRA